tara:strand:- start:1357 stop:1716 length:360 start_codon:yes stop_codon:yes gene_type:complete
MLAAMKGEESSDAPFEIPLCPRINQLARISFVIGIGDVIGGIYILFVNEDVNIVPLLLIALFLTSIFGAFCGHCACKQIRKRRPHQEGKAMAVFGLIGCYIYIGLCFFGFWLLSQYYIA